MNEAQGGGIAYSRIFNCARVHGGNIDFYDFAPVQETTIINYNRFTKISMNVFEGKILLNADLKLSLWKSFKISSETYTIITINELSLSDKFIECKFIKL
ncbi:MAG: hypothetical protein IAE93_14000 [Ignavibacteria bacterium]|nr:hypothetical protein [Ignavibacteria bacterium]